MKKNQPKTNPESKLKKLSLSELSNVSGGPIAKFIWGGSSSWKCQGCGTDNLD